MYIFYETEYLKLNFACIMIDKYKHLVYHFREGVIEGIDWLSQRVKERPDRPRPKYSS